MRFVFCCAVFGFFLLTEVAACVPDTLYWESGRLKSIGCLNADSTAEGYWKMYRDGLGDATLINGVYTNLPPLDSAGTFSKGIQEGYWEIYDYWRTLSSAGVYRHGVREGQWLDIGWRGIYDHGYKEGRWVYYGPVGNGDSLLFNEINYKRGLPHGIARAYYANGKMKFYCEYVDGLAHGKASIWNFEGVLIEEGQFSNGEMNGVWNYYDPVTGKLSSSGKYLHDEKDDVWTYYNESGKVIRKECYNAGKLCGS
ncbi:MAG TPA: toxin-antitoxin system YwqK family antitoxin [Bacteroidia bacterium]|nr:toxin-antitoxin system YwqK family antitoxin [Bacteroidia bacterium]